jgi:hypothetical protein
VHISRPVVIHGTPFVEIAQYISLIGPGFEIPAHRRWNDAYLISALGSQEISVAVTPDGCVLSLLCQIYKLKLGFQESRRHHAWNGWDRILRRAVYNTHDYPNPSLPS